jgi:hypothetical protein
MPAARPFHIFQYKAQKLLRAASIYTHRVASPLPAPPPRIRFSGFASAPTPPSLHALLTGGPIFRSGGRERAGCHTAGHNSVFTGCNPQKTDSLAADGGGEGHEFTRLCSEKTQV